MREVLLIDIVEALQEMEKSIYRTAKFIMSCKEFVKLPLSDKWLVFRHCSNSCCMLVRIYMSTQLFGYDLHDHRTIFGDDFYCYVDKFNFDSSTLGLTEENAKKVSQMLAPFGNQMSKNVMKPMKILRITKLELVYVIALVIWDVDNIEGLSDSTVDVAERFKEEAANELHNYYKFELRMTNYAYRICQLTNIVHAVDKLCDMRKEIFTIAKVFDMFSCAMFEKDSFL
uniref:NR LBD domain-containing protein n=1 Tax=Steinernema glaseri TaxID=37863 RepID=A0A1I8A1P7_9BILA